MSLYIDKKYINLVSSRLEKFKWKSKDTANYRCPICGDSAKNKNKARGYFYPKGNNILFSCHNCLRNWSFGHFLKEFDFSIYEQYIFERYKNGENGHSNYEKPKFDDQMLGFSFRPDFGNRHDDDKILGILNEYPKINELPVEHFARQYLYDRKIPQDALDDILFVPDFKDLVGKVEPNNTYSLKVNDPRIVIPFLNKAKKLIAFQGRSFSEKGLRYVTIKIDKDAPKIFGMDKINPNKTVFVLEGPLDAMFLPNAIARAGSKLDTKVLNNLPKRVFVFDNEKRKVEIVNEMVKMGSQGESVCVWPDSISEKDVNNMILSGKTPKNIVDIINKNTFTGLAAEIAITEWRRC